MRMVDLIVKKREGGVLSKEEIAFIVAGYTSGVIPDYQMAAWLMAVFFRGMDAGETALLTEQMAASGEYADLSGIDGIKIDKHSTGGVGDKTTLVVAPMAASCGLCVAKMSGRGLGFTGGTIDKLESIPGFQTTLEPGHFRKVLQDVGCAVTGAGGNLAPADKLMYALRDVTGTVESIPLIASSIMSKKLAVGTDGVVLDVKVGRGAFMKDLESARRLAETMVEIGKRAGRRTAALLTDMDRPLGRTIGNALEVEEAVNTLRGEGPSDLVRLCVELCATMLCVSGTHTLEQGRLCASKALKSGAALERFRKMIEAQGGDGRICDDPSLLPQASSTVPVLAQKDGYIAAMDTQHIGNAACILGAGREKKGDQVDSAAGIRLRKKCGDSVTVGEEIAVLHTNCPDKLSQAERMVREGIRIGLPPVQSPLIVDWIGL